MINLEVLSKRNRLKLPVVLIIFFLHFLLGTHLQAQESDNKIELSYITIQDSIIRADCNRMNIYNDLENDYYGIEGLCIRAFVGWCKAYADIDSVVIVEFEPSLKCIGRIIEDSPEENERYWQEQIDFFNRYAFSRESHYNRLNVADLLKSKICLAQVKVVINIEHGLECKVKIIAAIPEKNNYLNYQNVYFIYTFKPRLTYFEVDDYEQFYKKKMGYDYLFDENGFIEDATLIYQLKEIKFWGPYSRQLDIQNPPISVKSLFPINDVEFVRDY